MPGTDDGSGVIVEHSSNTGIRKHKTTNTTRYLVPICTPPSSRSDDFNGGNEASIKDMRGRPHIVYHARKLPSKLTGSPGI